MYKDTQYSGTNNVKLFTCLLEESINTKKKKREREGGKKPAATNDSNASNAIFGYRNDAQYTCDELWNGRTERSLEMFPRAAEGRPETHKKQNKAKSSKIITVPLPSWNHVTRCGLAWVMQYHAQVISTNDTHVQSGDLLLIWPWLLAIRPQIKINLLTSLFPQAKVCCFNHFHLTSGKLEAENENESQVSKANINRMLILFW